MSEIVTLLHLASKQTIGLPMSARLMFVAPNRERSLVRDVGPSIFMKAGEAIRAAEHELAEAKRDRETADERHRLEVLGLEDRIRELEKYLDTPELHDFAKGVVVEAQHQRKRWGVEHDAGKADEDWFWLVGYLAGKALSAAKAGNHEKALHHTISTAAVLANWHAALSGADTSMRPGIDPAPVEGSEA